MESFCLALLAFSLSQPRLLIAMFLGTGGQDFNNLKLKLLTAEEAPMCDLIKQIDRTQSRSGLCGR